MSPGAARMGRLGLTIATGLAILLAIVTATPADAAADARIIRSSFESRFPESIVARVEAAVTRPIVRAYFQYRVVGRRPIAQAPVRTSAAPGVVAATHTIDLTRDYLPPGTSLEYRWQFVDDREQEYVSPFYAGMVDDLRVVWRTQTIRGSDVRWPPGDDAFDRAIQATVDRAILAAAAEVGAAPPRGLRVTLYGDFEQFRTALYRGSAEWVGGTYYPEESVIVAYAPRTNQGLEIARRALAHEFAHSAVHALTDNPFGEVPSWLNEGLASRAEGASAAQYGDALTEGVATRRLLSLRALSGSFPADPEAAQLAYAQSASVVTYIVERRGRGSTSALLRAYAQGVTFDDGAMSALGTDIDTLDVEWRSWLAPWALTKTTPRDDPPPIEPPSLDPIALLRGAIARLVGGS